MSNNILYLHGRPSSHFLHKALASSLGVEPRLIDEDDRWQDQHFGTFRNALAWLKNAFAYKKYKTYSYILIDGLHFSPVLARKLGILPKRIVLMAHMGNQLPYFFLSRKIPLYSRLMHAWLLNNYDHVFCEGQMIREMLLQMKPGLKTQLHLTFLGPLEERIRTLRTIKPELSGKVLLTIASGPGADRVFYKGLDLSTEAFRLALAHQHELQYYIVGDWNEADKESLLVKFSAEQRKHVHFIGYSSHIEKYLAMADLYVHTARGDAFPTSTIESMHAGVPVIVSEVTGTKEILKEAGLDFTVSLAPEDIAAKITWYFDLDVAAKKNYSERFRNASEKYSENAAIRHYQQTFEYIKQLETTRLSHR